jgi:hypothetical protein
MSMIGGLPATGNTYQVTVSIDNTQTAASINQMVSGFRSMDANFSAAVSQMRQTMGQLGAQARGQLSEIPNTFAGMGQNAQGAMSSIGRLAASFGVFSTGRQLVEGMRDSLTDLRTYTEKMNQDLVNMQLRLAEVQSITGNVGKDSSKVLQQHLEMMKYTGMTSEQAVGFTGQFVGEAEVSRAKFDPGQFNLIQQQAARFAMVHGGDPTTHAIMAGRLAGFYDPTGRPVEGQAQDVLTRQANLYAGLNLVPGNTANVTRSYVTALARLVSPTGRGGMVGSPEALANLTVAAAGPAGEASGIDTTLEQFARGVTGQGRAGKWQEFLRNELKIPAEAPAEVAMVPVFKRLQEVEATGASLTDYMQKQGLTSSTERLAIASMYRARGLIDVAANRPVISPEEAQKQINEPYILGSRGERRELIYQRAVAGTRAAQIEDAQQNQLAEIFRARAITELTKSHEIGPQWQAGLDVGQRFDQMITNQIYGQDFKSRQAIDERAAMIYERETRQKLPGHAKFEKEGASWQSTLFGISDRFVNEEYVLGNQLSADINAAESGRRFGFNAASGAATGKAMVDDPEVKKAIIETRDHARDTRDHTRKDRPMTVAKPAPSPRP